MYHAKNVSWAGVFQRKSSSSRRGTVLVLTAFLMVFMVGVIAFAVDVGYVLTSRTQLQAAADAAALAAAGTMGQNDQIVANAQQIGGMNYVGTQSVQILPSDVVIGTWDPNEPNPAARFQPLADQSEPGNAVKVTARADQTTQSVPLFFARVWNKHSVNLTAEAIATTNPRDICFVVDLSASMNVDTDPYWNPSYPELIQKVYDDLGFGTYPGSQQSYNLYQLYSQLSNPSIPDPYRIYYYDSYYTKQIKAYSWIIDIQVPNIMPAALPVPDSQNSTSYNYWKSYLSSNLSKVGYKSYVNFMLKKGRDGAVYGDTYAPWATASPDCIRNTDPDPIPGVSINLEFPVREQPTHSCRRAIIAAIQVIWDRNVNTPTNLRDKISVITYDKNEDASNPPSIAHPLDDDYEQAMYDCADLQATHRPTSYGGTATGYGLQRAIEYLNASGRIGANKVVVLLTDGLPNIYEPDPNNDLSAFINDGEYSNLIYTSGWYKEAKNSALMQAALIQGGQWAFYPVSVGNGTDESFMKRMYSVSLGENNADFESVDFPYSGGIDPLLYETYLREIFIDIVSNPKLRLVR